MKKMIFGILIIAAIAIAVNLLGNQASQDTVLAKEMDSLLENGETKMDLTRVTNFDWTQVDVFGPYTPDEAIEEAMGITFKGDNGGIDMLDNRFLLVFADEKKAVKTVVLSRKYGIYSVIDNKVLSVEQ